MKIGIVGGTGNISQPFVKLLLEQGHEVVCANRGESRQIHPGARLVQIDQRDRSRFESLMQAENSMRRLI